MVAIYYNKYIVGRRYTTDPAELRICRLVADGAITQAVQCIMDGGHIEVELFPTIIEDALTVGSMIPIERDGFCSVETEIVMSRSGRHIQCGDTGTA